MAISLPQMRHVIAVAEAGSFRAAGERLGVQQSAISRSVREFEESLGAKVFDRRSTGAKLTPVGEHLMPEILTILDAIDGLALKARSFRPANAGRFALGLDLALSIAHIQPILTALRDDDSGLQITLVERSACEVVTAIQEGQVQLGLIRGRELPKGISARRFLVGDLFAVIPGDWLDDGEVIDHLRLGACPLHVASADIAADGVAKLRQVLGDGINLTSHDCTPSSLVGLVASGLGIGLTTSIPPEASALGMKIVAVKPPIPVVGVTALWSTDSTHLDIGVLLDQLGLPGPASLPQSLSAEGTAPTNEDEGGVD